MTDKEIAQALIARDEKVTRQFFFEKCRPLFLSIINRVFPFDVEYDEFVNELYIELIQDDAKKLRQYEGRSSIYQWLKTVAIRFFMRRRDEIIDDSSKEGQLSSDKDASNEETTLTSTAHIDIKRLLDLIGNQRNAHVIKRLILEGASPQETAAEMAITVDNLYNIKKRAITALTQVALNDIKCYGKRF